MVVGFPGSSILTPISSQTLHILFRARRNSYNKRALFKDLEVILTTRNRAPSLSTTIVHHCIQIFTWQGSAWTGFYAYRAHHRTSSTTMQIHDLQSMLDDVRLMRQKNRNHDVLALS